MKKILLLAAFLLLPLAMQAEYLTIGNTSSTSKYYYAPFNRWYNYSATSVLYTQSELGDSKILTHIAFDKVQGNTNYDISDVEIYVRHVTSSSLSTGYSYDTDDYTLIYEGDFENASSTGWQEVELDSQFEYNGEDNLQFLFIKNYEQYASGYPYWRYTSTSSTQCIYAYNDNAMPTSITSGFTYKPNVRFQYIAAPDLAVTDITLPEQPYYQGSFPVTATASYVTGLDVLSFDIHWSVNGVEQGMESWTGTLNKNNKSVTFDFGNYDFSYDQDETNYNAFSVKVWVDNINELPEDKDPSNDDMTSSTIPVLDDIGLIQIVEPRGNVSLGDQDVIVELKNYGARTITSAKILWAVDGVNQVAYTWSGTLYSLGTVEINVGTYYFSTKVPLAPYVISAQSDLPNGNDVDENTENDACPVSTVGPPIVPDTYYIGGSDGFRNFEELNAYVASSGIAGEGTYTFIIKPGTYTDKLAFPLTEVNKDYSFVFKSSTGNPKDVKISLTSAGSDDKIFDFNNMYNILFRDVTFELPGKFGTMVELNNCNNIEVQNCIFNNGGNALVQNYDSEDTRNLKVKNCKFNDIADVAILQNYGGFDDENYTFIENNEFTGAKTAFNRGVVVSNGSTVRYNHFMDLSADTDPDNTLIFVDGFGEDTELDSNTTENVMNYNGIIVDGATSGMIKKNSMKISSEGDFYGLMVNTSHLDINQNEFVTGGTGNSVKIYASEGMFSNNMIASYNNTALYLDDNKDFYVIYNSVQNGSRNNPTVSLRHDDSFVYRNIFSSLDDAPVLWSMNSEGALMDENTYYANGEDFASYNGQMFVNIDQWRLNSGQDANTNITKPPFKNPDNLFLVRVVDELIIENPVDLNLTEDQRIEFENIDYNDDIRGNQNDYYKGADAVTPDINIMDNPRDIMTCEGDTTVMFAVSATVTYNAQLRYQWYMDGVKMEDETDVVLDFPGGVTYKNSGYYSCEISVRGGKEPLLSETAALYVLTQPEIVKQSYINETQGTDNRYALEGDIVRLEVETHMRGITPPYYKDKYQWYFYDDATGKSTMLKNSDARYNGTMSSELSIDGVNANDLKDGNYYYVMVEGLCGEATSTPYTLAEAPEYYITFNNQPVPQNVCESGATQFTIIANGSDDVTEIKFQWYKDDVPVVDNSRITGANTNQLRIMDILPSDEGEYYLEAVTVPGDFVYETSTALLTVSPLPTITKDIDSDKLDVEINSHLVLSIEADDVDVYQWYKDGSPLYEETASELDILIDNENQAGEYYCLALNDCGDRQSITCTVSVVPEGSVGVADHEAAGYKLYNAEPNPVSNNSIIKFTTPVSQDVEMYLTDANGNRVANLFNGLSVAGINKVEINAQNLELSSGVYYYTLITNQYRITNKLVIVK